MNRDNILFAIIGILLGFIVGFMFAGNMSQQMSTPNVTQRLPPDHPPIQSGGGQDPQQTFAEVQASIAKARNEPNNFAAQIQAARLFYQIQRYDQAIEFLLKANQIKPDDYDVIVMLGEANMDAGNYEVAEKWYRIAAKREPKDVAVLASLAFISLQRGDAVEAEKAIANFEKVAPNSEDLPRFRQSSQT